jgi:hypothetical protein
MGMTDKELDEMRNAARVLDKQVGLARDSRQKQQWELVVAAYAKLLEAISGEQFPPPDDEPRQH